MIAAALVGGVLGLGPAAANGAEPAAAIEDQGAREARSIAGGWLSINPLGFGVPGPGASPDLAVLDRAVRASYRWGFSAGITFEPVDHLMINAAGAFDQNVWIFDNDDQSYELCFRGDCYGWTERGFGHFTRLGADLRIGWANRRVLAWALASAHVGLSRIRIDCDNSVEPHCGRSETDLGPGVGGGLGAAVRITGKFAAGLETSVDHSWLDRRDDPFRAVRTWDLALIAIVRF